MGVRGGAEVTEAVDTRGAEARREVGVGVEVAVAVVGIGVEAGIEIGVA